MPTLLVGRIVVRGVGTVAILGGLLFLWDKIPSIGYFLIGAGIIFWIFTVKWKQRYLNVLSEVPEGYQATGEVYPNPGGPSPVEVYFKGIHRIYVHKP